MHNQTYIRRIYTTIQDEVLHNIGLLKRGFRFTASLRLNKTLKVFAVSSRAGIAGERHFGTTFFHCICPGLFTATSYATFFQSCCNMWICKIGCRYGSCMIRCSTTRSSCSSGVRAFLNKVFPELWIGRGGPTAWIAGCPDLNPLYYYL
jgi:hypothetical protein